MSGGDIAHRPHPVAERGGDTELNHGVHHDRGEEVEQRRCFFPAIVAIVSPFFSAVGSHGERKSQSNHMVWH
jgi:hypothetical protein